MTENDGRFVPKKIEGGICFNWVIDDCDKSRERVDASVSASDGKTTSHGRLEWIDGVPQWVPYRDDIDNLIFRDFDNAKTSACIKRIRKRLKKARRHLDAIEQMLDEISSIGDSL